MILIDTSAWIEYRRSTGSPECVRVRELVATDAAVCVTEPVVMELMAGIPSGSGRQQLTRFIRRFEWASVAGLDDYEKAADVYLRCRAGGETVRSMIDCLIAAVALRTGSAVLHRDRDFDVIARYLPLQLA